MKRREFLLLASMTVGMAALGACSPSSVRQGGNGNEAATATPSVEPMVYEWTLGAKGGLGSGAAFVSQEAWEPKRLEVPVDQPFIIRFMPRDQNLHTIGFGQAFAAEMGAIPPDLVMNGEPVQSGVLTIKSHNKVLDVFCRQHRGAGGFGSIVTR